MTIKQGVEVVDERQHGPNWDAWLSRAENLRGAPLAESGLLHAESCYRAGWSPARAINTLH